MAVVRVRVSSPEQLVREVCRLFPDQIPQGLVVMGYGSDGRVCGVAVNREHRALSWVKVWELAGLADDLDARSIALVIFPTGPSPTPSAHELAVYADLQVRARRARLLLVDCFVWRGERLWSLREMHERCVSA
jgi:hypothetical protein